MQMRRVGQRVGVLQVSLLWKMVFGTFSVFVKPLSHVLKEKGGILLPLPIDCLQEVAP